MESLTIQKLFDAKNRQFEIPAYQRSYSWGKTQIEQFIDDLRNASSQYYLGHFLFESSSDNTLLIIDGQQRLTTCVIFFSSLRNELSSRKQNGEKVSIDLDDIADYYIRDIRKGTQKFKTVEYDNNFFVNEVIDRTDSSQKPATRSQEKIRKAKKMFGDVLAKTETNEIERWYNLVQNATITQYVVSNKAEAAQIFAFQNDRGKALSKLEILKSYFMLQIYLSSVDKDLINENIKYLENEFSTIYQRIVNVDEKEDDVINYYWRAVSGKGYFSDEIVEGVKKQLSEQADKIVWIKNFVSGVAQAFDTVLKVKKSDYSYIVNLFDLNNMALSYPFFIKCDRCKVTDDTFKRMARFLENITFRSLIRGGRADVESRLNWFLINGVTDGKINGGIDAMIQKIKTDWWWGYWSDNELMRCVDTGWFYKNRVDNYLLWKYELYLCNENHPKPHQVTFKDLIRNESIEHIAPQTPTNGDPIANGYGDYEGKSGIASGEWLNCVGNLMLISQSHNSSIGNKPFAEKLASYGKDNLLNQQKEIVDFVENKNNPVWDKTAIEKRHEKIKKAVKDIWDLNKI
ncbi:MAG: DUF262 domain-containing HNH endonuclease family protein [Bacteroidales bacterium]|nr:DUF262 domain-containing HNH endonuclease family protein [Bacteroidales bacterium]